VKIDRNRDNFISQSELKELIMNIKFVKASMEVEEAVALVIEELDIDNDRIINEEEFVAGFQKWLSSTSAPAPVSHSESQEDMYQVNIFSMPFVQSEQCDLRLFDFVHTRPGKRLTWW